MKSVKILFALLALYLLLPALFALSPDEKLFDGLRRGDQKAMSSALDEGAAPDLADSKAVTILMMAVTFGQTETVKLLLEKGADVNLQDNDGNTALMRAAANNRLEIAKMLLEKNADLYLENNNGEGCLSIAVRKGFPGFAAFIMKPGMGELSYPMLLSAARSHSEDLYRLIESQALALGSAVKPGTSLIPFRRNKKFGFIDPVLRDVVIPPRFDRVGHFDGGECQVKEGNKWGIIDSSGRYVMKSLFEAIRGSFAYGATAIPVKQGGKWGFADKSGKIVLAPAFDDIIFNGNEDVIPVKVKNKWGFIDKSGNFLVKPTFDGVAASFSEGADIVPVRVKRKWGFADKDGKMVIQPLFDYAKSFNQGLAPVKVAGKWGYAGRGGQIVISPKFDDAMPFDDYGFACIRDNTKRKFGCIDKTGKVVIEEQFDRPVVFAKDGTAALFIWGVFFRIDNSGRIIAPVCFTGRKFDAPPKMSLLRILMFFVLPVVVILGVVLLFVFFRRRNKWAVRAIRPASISGRRMQ